MTFPIFGPFAKTVGSIRPSPFSGFQPFSLDFADISSHHGNSKSRAMSRNQGVNEEAIGDDGQHLLSAVINPIELQLTFLRRKHFLELIFRDILRIANFVGVDIEGHVQCAEENVVDYSRA